MEERKDASKKIRINCYKIVDINEILCYCLLHVFK